MISETRPDIHGLDDVQRQLALAHWYLWLLLQRHQSWQPDIVPILMSLESIMQPITAHRMAQARGRYWRE